MLASLLALSLGATPASIQAVTPTSALLLFETDAPVAAQATCAPGAGGGKAARAEDAAPTTRHRLAVTGLAPDQAYACRLEAGPASASEVRFRTAPSQPTRFRFAVVGDSRDHAQWAGVAKAILSKEPAFVLITGDSVEGHGYSSSAEAEEDWRGFFRAGAPLFAQTPVFASPGNHDVGPAYALYNAAPRSSSNAESYYAFTWGGAAIVAVDTNRAGEAAMDGWLRDALPKLSGGPLFVFMHHPLYSCGVHGSSEKLQSLYRDLFSSAHVTAAFAGHDHDLIDWGDVGGVSYAVSGGGGTVLYPLTGCQAHFAQQAYGFVVVEVDGAKVTETFYDQHGTPLHTAGPLAAPSPSFDAKRAALVLAR